MSLPAAPNRPAAAPVLRALATLALALGAAVLCQHWRTPIPWMMGPLLATAALSALGAPTASLNPLRNAGQWVIGMALGLYFTPQVGALIVGLWWAIALGIAWSLALGLGFSAWLARLHAPHMPGVDRATWYFAGAIGGASEMTLIAERVGARTDLVAAAHSLRVLIVTVLVPFAFAFSGAQGADPLPPPVRAVQPEGLALLAALALAGVGLMHWLDRANPWFMGALVASMTATLAGAQLGALPPGLSEAAQLVIGVSLGVRFTPAFVHLAPRWLGSVALATLAMIGLCAAFGWLLAWATGLHPATLILGTAPGGIAEMAITAKVLQLGVPVVTAFQVCRLVAVLLLAEPVWKRFFADLR